jgi:hypothetical protein
MGMPVLMPVVVRLDDDFRVLQTLDRAAGVADEVRVLVDMQLVGAAGVVGEGKAKHAVAGIDSVGDVGVDESVERAIHGDSIRLLAGSLRPFAHGVEHLLGCDGAGGLLKHIEHEQPDARHPELGPTQKGRADIAERGISFIERQGLGMAGALGLSGCLQLAGSTRG